MSLKLVPMALLGSLAAIATLGCDIAPGDIPPRKTDMYSDTTMTRPNQPVTLPNGGLFSSGNGFLIGQLPDKTDKAEADAAGKQAQQAPASPQQARQSATADLNKDGFVTLDEVVAMRDAGLDDQIVVRRLEATGQVFRLTSPQEDYLINHGVSRTVVDRLRILNPTTPPPATAASPNNDVGNRTQVRVGPSQGRYVTRCVTSSDDLH